MQVIFEPKVEKHAPDLYHAHRTASKTPGLEAVDADAVQRYQDDGFLVVERAYTEQEVRAARQALHEMTRADDPGCDAIYFEGALRDHFGVEDDRESNAGKDPDREQLALGAKGHALPDVPVDLRARYVRKFMGFTNRHAALGGLAKKPELLDVTRRLVDESPCAFQDMAMIKPPGGREKPWHQDHAYFNLPINTPVVGVWIALDEVGPHNGCMYVLAGGHKEGPRHHFMRRDWQICDTDIEGCEMTAVPMNPGDALLFDAKLPHGTPTNQSDEYRWAVQLHYVPASAVETADEERLAVFGTEGKNVTC
jgi:phytanoyl-CoA hydroxylase